MNPLDVPFEDLAFRLPCNGRVYTVAIERFVTLPLQSPERLFGRLCAAVLQSTDDFFPRPYRGEQGESPADDSEACVIYADGQSEGLFPERLRSQIAWEDVARARIV